MWFARGIDEPATSIEVRLLSDLSQGAEANCFGFNWI